MRRYFLQNRLLPLRLHVVVGDKQAMCRWATRRFGKNIVTGPSNSAGAFVESTAPPKPCLEAVIWLPYYRKGNVFDAGKLAHEALHVAWEFLDVIGIGRNEEAHCYVVQWIVEEVTYRLTRKPRA